MTAQARCLEMADDKTILCIHKEHMETCADWPKAEVNTTLKMMYITLPLVAELQKSKLVNLTKPNYLAMSHTFKYHTTCLRKRPTFCQL